MINLSASIRVRWCKGVYFAVWAPTAHSVSVIGDFNFGLKENTYSSKMGFLWYLGRIHTQCWKGSTYKYKIQSNNGGIVIENADPFAFFLLKPPYTASVVWDLDYKWDDAKWMENRKDYNALDKPYSVYEVHLGSWKRHEEDNRFWLISNLRI
jgi:1,4-alpha-glucan branching enzyme